MGRLGYYSKLSFQAPKEVIPKKQRARTDTALHDKDTNYARISLAFSVPFPGNTLIACVSIWIV